MRQKRNLALIAFSVVFLLFIAGCGDGGAVIGGALPVIGGITAGAKKFLGKFIPESLVKSATRLKQGEKTIINSRLKNIGEFDKLEKRYNAFLKQPREDKVTYVKTSKTRAILTIVISLLVIFGVIALLQYLT